MTKFSKLEPGEENTHESCAKTRQSSHKNSTRSMSCWMNSIWKKRLYCGLLLVCERPTGHQSISPIPHLKGYGFSFILWGDILDIWGRFVTRDVCKWPQHLHHWNRHSISDPVIPHVAVYNAYHFVTERINTLTVFVRLGPRDRHQTNGKYLP